MSWSCFGNDYYHIFIFCWLIEQWFDRLRTARPYMRLCVMCEAVGVAGDVIKCITDFFFHFTVFSSVVVFQLKRLRHLQSERTQIPTRKELVRRIWTTETETLSSSMLNQPACRPFHAKSVKNISFFFLFYFHRNAVAHSRPFELFLLLHWKLSFVRTDKSIKCITLCIKYYALIRTKWALVANFVRQSRNQLKF